MAKSMLTIWLTRTADLTGSAIVEKRVRGGEVRTRLACGASVNDQIDVSARIELCNRDDSDDCFGISRKTPFRPSRAFLDFLSHT